MHERVPGWPPSLSSRFFIHSGPPLPLQVSLYATEYLMDAKMLEKIMTLRNVGKSRIDKAERNLLPLPRLIKKRVSVVFSSFLQRRWRRKSVVQKRSYERVEKYDFAAV